MIYKTEAIEQRLGGKFICCVKRATTASTSFSLFFLSFFFFFQGKPTFKKRDWNARNALATFRSARSFGRSL